MEVDKLLLKTFYLVILLILFYMILSSNSQISKINRIMISFLFSILGVYFTFEYLYNHLFIMKDEEPEEEKEEEEENTQQSIQKK